MSQYQEQDEIKEFLSRLTDNHFWKPFSFDQSLVDEFDRRLKIVHDSKDWPKARNKEKGNVLEEFVKFLFDRFTILESITRTHITSDNEIDVDVVFNDNLPMPFIIKIKNKAIVECKNVYSKSVDVGMVSKLVELCECRNAGIGIFISVKGLSGRGWKYAEGKRRKLFLSTGVPCISFKISELEELKNPDVNLLTMIKRKYQALIDEIDDDGPVLNKASARDPEFIDNLVNSLNVFRKFLLITDDEKKAIIDRIDKRYGKHTDP